MRCASLLNPGLPLQRYLFWSNCAFWTTRLVSVCCVGFCNGFSSSTIFSGGSRGAPPPLTFHETEARKAETFFWDRTPPILRVWMTAPPPLSEGLDPPMILEFATNGILALIPFKIGKLSSFLGCVPWLLARK